MEAYILIVVIVGQTASIEFNDAVACVHAACQIEQQINGTGHLKNWKAWSCVPRGGTAPPITPEDKPCP